MQMERQFSRIVQTKKKLNQDAALNYGSDYIRRAQAYFSYHRAKKELMDFRAEIENIADRDFPPQLMQEIEDLLNPPAANY